MRLPYEAFTEYFAKRCKLCNGAKRVKVNGVWASCSCQYYATIRYRLEQIPITPPSLKYKTWSDFTGEIRDVNAKGETEIVGQLDTSAFVAAKQKAMQYCFGTADPAVLNDRENRVIVHKHARDGQNVIISGPKQTGRSLLGLLVLREVIFASTLHRLNLDFRWVKASEILHAARWDENKAIDHDHLDELANVDFLVIDGVELQKQGYGHTGRADSISLDVFFGERRGSNLPTIVICSDEFLACSRSRQYVDLIERSWGSEFVELVTEPTNVVIELQKKVKKIANRTDSQT